jgi:hypothetical protein
VIVPGVVRLSLTFPLLATMLWATSSLAATVVLVRPSNPARGLTEALARINGELASAGFDVEVVNGSVAQGKDGESRSWLEQLAVRRGADAVVAVMGDETPDSVEVWVIDKVTGKSVVRRVPFRPMSATGPETLAIQAVELLRASFLEIDLSSRANPKEAKPAPPPTVVHFVEMERKAEQSNRFGIEVGGAASMSFGGVGTAVMPVARFDWAARPWLVAQATVAGMGSRPTVEAGSGSAQVAQAFALLGAGYHFRSSKRLVPFVSLSAGILHTSVEGRADLPLQGRHADQWSLLLDGEFGAAVALHGRLYLSLSAHAQGAEAYPAIRFDGKEVATYSRPNILLTLTIGAWL